MAAQADERYHAEIVARGTPAHAEYSQTQTTANDIRLKAQSSAEVKLLYHQAELAGTTQSAAASTREYLLGESATAAALQTNLAQQEYTFATATLGASAAQSMAGAAAEIGYTSATRSALNDWNTAYATAWSDFRSADYTQRTTSLVSFASTLGTPWAQFQLAQAQTESAWWTSRTGAYQNLVSSLNSAADQYQAEDNAHYLTLRATQVQADSSYAQATASLDYRYAVAQATAEDAFVQATVPAAEQYQVSSATVQREITLKTALYAAGQSTAPAESATVLTRPAYTGYASAYLTAVADRRTALATAEQAYRSESATANSAYSATYADAQQNYDVAQSLSNKTRALAVDQLLSGYQVSDRSSYAAALDDLAVTNGTPWAWLAADEAASWSTYTSSASSATTTRTGAESTPRIRSSSSGPPPTANWSKTKPMHWRPTRRRWAKRRWAARRRKTENAADAASAASGQYTSDEPDWGLEEDWSTTAPAYQETGADYAAGKTDGAVSTAFSRSFSTTPSAAPSGNASLSENLTFANPPSVSLDATRTAPATVAAQAASIVSQTVACTSPAVRSTASNADWETYKATVKTTGSDSTDTAVREYNEFQRLAGTSPDVAAAVPRTEPVSDSEGETVKREATAVVRDTPFGDSAVSVQSSGGGVVAFGGRLLLYSANRPRCTFEETRYILVFQCGVYSLDDEAALDKFVVLPLQTTARPSSISAGSSRHYQLGEEPTLTHPATNPLPRPIAIEDSYFMGLGNMAKVGDLYLRPTTVTIVTDSPGMSDFEAWRKNTTGGWVYGLAHNNEQVIEVLERHAALRGKIQFLNLSGHGSGKGGVRYDVLTIPSFDAKGLTIGQKKRLRAVLTPDAVITIWGCRQAGVPTEMQALANDLRVVCWGTYYDTDPGPNPYCEMPWYVPDIAIEIKRMRSGVPTWSKFSPKPEDLQ